MGREDLAHAVQRDHALGQPGAAGVPEPDHRHPLPDGRVDRVHDVPAPLDAHGAAHPGGVGGEGDRGGAVDLAARVHHAGVVARDDQAQRAAVEEGAHPHLGVALIGGG